jgi:hypothetical protein
MNPWLDFSGAPAMLIPTSAIAEWRGSLDPNSSQYSDLDTVSPKTDYDRACIAASRGNAVVPVGVSSALILYSEYDEHMWMERERVVASGSWMPNQVQLANAEWIDPIEWAVNGSDFFLMNSAANGTEELRNEDCIRVKLASGRYLVEFTFIEGDYLGCFTRLSLVESRSP